MSVLERTEKHRPERASPNPDPRDLDRPQLAAPDVPEQPLSLWRHFKVARRNELATIPRAAYQQPVYERRLLWFRTVLISDPAAVKEVLLDAVADYPKTDIEKRVLSLAAGQGILTTDGEIWRAHRRIMAPSFDHRSIQSYAPAMTELSLRRLEHWDALPDGSVVDIAGEMMLVTLDIIARTMFSAESADMVAVTDEALRDFQKTLFFNLLDFTPVIGPLRWRRREAEAKRIFAEFDRVIRRLIDDRMKSGAGSTDLLGRLIAARDEELGGRLSAEDLRDQVVTIFLAGHETMAVAMSWTWYLLSQHPQVVAKLEAELGEVLGGRPPRHEDLAKLPYARKVIEESMRLYPPAPGLSMRMAKADRVLAGTRVAKGSLVAIAPWVLHRHELLWDEPLRFDPERFSPERAAGRHRFAYMPFGAGPRICIGFAFAMTEAILILATMAQRYRLHLVPGQDIEPFQAITLRARNGIKMQLERKA